MKTRCFTFVLVVLILTALLFPINAKADTSRYRGSGKVAMAFFTSVDQTGIQTDVYLSVQDFEAHYAPEPGSRSESMIELNIRRFDSTCPYYVPGCPGLSMNAHVLSSQNRLADKDFTLPAVSNGAWASLNTSVTAVDYISKSSFDVDLSLHWTCEEDVSWHSDPTHFVVPGESVEISISQGKYCLAQASGTITNGLIDFAPVPSSQGEWPTLLASDRSIEVQILK